MGSLLNAERHLAAAPSAVAKGLRREDLSALQSASFSSHLGALLDEWGSTCRGGRLFERMRMVLRELAFNVPLPRAVAIAGVGLSTAEGWCRRGDEVVKACPPDQDILSWLRDAVDLPIEDRECAVFALLIVMADSLAQSRLVGVMTELAVGREEKTDENGNLVAGFRPSFQATAWLLERRWPDEWGAPKQRLDITSETTVDVHFEGDRLEGVLSRLSELEGGLTRRGFAIVDAETVGTEDEDAALPLMAPPEEG